MWFCPFLLYCFLFPHLFFSDYLLFVCVLYNIIGCSFDIMYSKCIECVVVILFTVCFLLPHLCCCDYLLFESVLYNIKGCNLDIMLHYIQIILCSMNSKYIECVMILFTVLFCFSHLCCCDYLSSEFVV